MSERTPDGSALGFSDIALPEPEQDPLSDEFVDETEGAPAPEPEPQPEPEPEPDSEPDFDEQDEEFQPPAPQGEVAPEQPEQPEQPEHLFAGKYQSEQALEQGYKELQAQYTREAQARAALEQRQAQMEQVIGQLVPVLEQQLMANDPEMAEQYKQQQLIREQAAAIAEQQIAPLREQLTATQHQAQVESLVNEFRSRHPDATAGGPVDRLVVTTAEDLGVNPANLDMLELAYEAGHDPYLKHVLKANPPLIDSAEGIAYARIQARLLQGLAGQGGRAQAEPTPEQKPRPQGSAYVETGEGGAPARAASAASTDEFDEALESWAKERRSPLFGS